MKQFFTYTFYAKKTFRFLLLLLILLVAIPIIEAPQAEAQTTKTGNFFTKRFKRKNKFKRKSQKSTAFKRKPFSCEDIGKTKVAQIKVSKKQLRRWEEERQVKVEQEKLKEQRQAKNNVKKQEENIVLSASAKNNIEEVANQKKELETKKAENTELKKEETTEQLGWYSSEKPELPQVSPIIVNQKNEITSQKNRQELEIAAKHARLGYKIVLESNNEKQLETVKNYLMSIGTENESIEIKSSETTNQNEVSVTIEK